MMTFFRRKSSYISTRRTRFFGWGAIVLSVAICGMVTWHHVKENRTLSHTLTVLDSFRQARIDLMESFLCACLAENTTPANLPKGETELKEAITSFESIAAQLDPSEKKHILLFQQKAQTFRDQLVVWEKADKTLRANKTAALLATFDDLVRQADQLDQRTRIHVRIHAARNNDQFGIAIIVAALLLSVLCAVILYMGFTSERFENASLKFANRFREAMEAMHDGLWDLNIETGETYYSPGYWRMLGYDDKSGPSSVNSWVDLLHPDDRDQTLALTQQCFAGERDSFETECRMKTKDGTWKWILSRGNVVAHDSQGKAIRMVGSNVDIAERKRAESALCASEEQFRSIFQMVSIGIVQVDPQNGQIIRFNDAYLKIIGYSANELYKLRFTDLTHPDDREKDWELFSRAVRGELTSYANEKRYVRKDGSVIWVLINASFLRDNTGKAVRGVGICKDITKQKIAEEERAKLQNQLMQIQKMDSIGRLAGGIAHDLNNILGIVVGHVDLMRDRIAPPNPLAEDLEEIQNADSRAAKLIGQLLAFARKQPVSPKVLNLNEAVGDMLKMLKRLINENIELVWKPGDSLWPVLIDSIQMDQILANLCVNARDAIGGTGTITISTDNVTFGRAQTDVPPGDYVALTVSDTGCGMDAQTQAHIFEPFFTTKEMGHGTGLGLATVYGIVQQNGGFIRVVSTPQEGAVFKIVFPRHTETDNADLPVSATPMKKGHGEVILLVEDDRPLLKLITLMLQGDGYTVLSTSRPCDAIRIAETKKENIRLLITDIVIPDMSGYEMERKIRKQCPALVTLFMSGHTDESLPDTGTEEAAAFFIRKPFSQFALSEKVRYALEHGHEKQRREETPPPQPVTDETQTT